MLRKLWQLTNRFRWPLAGALVTLLALYWWLQPRVQEERQASLDTSPLPGTISSMQVSPSGKYLLFIDSDATTLHLYDQAGMKRIFKHSGLNAHSYGFDSDDRLVYCSKPVAQSWLGSFWFYFWHWTPGDTAPSKVVEHRAYPIAIKYPGQKGPSSECLLSPDARTWLIPMTGREAVHFTCVDAHTGKERHELEMLVTDLMKTRQPMFLANYSPDGKTLLMQVKQPAVRDSDSFQLLWFEAANGKLLKSKNISDNTSMHDLGYFVDDQVAGVLQKGDQFLVQLYSDLSGQRQVYLDETTPQQAEQRWPTAKDAVWITHTELSHRFDKTGETVVYCWQHILKPKIRGSNGYIPSVPGFSYGVRDLNTGKVIHTERLPDRPRQDRDWQPEGWSMLDVLPGSVLVLVLRHPKLEPTAWQKRWEEWRSRYIPWFSAASSRNDSLLFLEATTGKRLAELETSLTHVKQFYHPAQQALYLAGQRNDQLVVQKYDYPLYKPWHIILAWVAGVFVVMAGVQWWRLGSPFSTRET